MKLIILHQLTRNLHPQRQEDLMRTWSYPGFVEGFGVWDGSVSKALVS